MMSTHGTGTYVLAIWLLAVSAADAQTTHWSWWTNTGPGRPSVRDLIVDPREYDTVYVVTRGGLYKSTDAGATWTLLIPALPAVASEPEPTPGSFAIAYSDSRILYFAAGASLYKSTNRGATWMKCAAAISAPLAVDPQDPQTVYGGRHLRRSTDGGATSVSVPVTDGVHSPFWLSTIVIDPADTSTLFVTGLIPLDGSNVDATFRSTDRGGSWQLVNPAATLLTNTSTLFLGDRWVNDNAWLSLSDPWMLRRRWSMAPPVLLPDVRLSPPSLLPPSTYAITVGPTTLFAESSCVGQAEEVCTGLFRSTTGGRTWTTVRGLHNPRLQRANSVAIARAESRRMYAFLSSEPLVPQANYVTVDGGTSWMTTGTLPAPPGQLFVDAADAAVLYASAASAAAPTFHKSIDAGANWSSIEGDLPVACREAYERHLFADPVRPGVLYTTSGTATCTGIYRSQDGGGHWTQWATFEGVFGTDISNATGPVQVRDARLFIDPSRPAHIYASVRHWHRDTTTGGTGGEGFARSTDGGATFTALPRLNPAGPSLVQQIAFDPARAGVLYAIVGFVSFTNPGSAVLQSVDDGISWLPIDAPTAMPYLKSIQVDGRSNVYVADVLGGVFTFRWGAMTWTPLGLPEVDELLPATSTGIIHAVTRRNGIWRLAEPCTSLSFPVTALAGRTGGRRSVHVETSTPGCIWSASTPAAYPWLTIVGSSFQAGPGTITYDVAPNAVGGSRVGIVKVGDAVMNVLQNDRPNGDGSLDFNGDGRGDVFAIDRRNGEWTIYFADGVAGFTVGSRGGWLPTWTILPADFNGDGLSDFLLYHPVNGLWYRAISNGLGGFTYSNGGWRPQLTPYVVHLDRDALSDVLLYDAQTGEFWTACGVEGGTRFEYTAGGWSPGWQITPLAQPDGSDDLLLYNDSSGVFYTVSNLGSHKEPAQPAVYQGGGWRGSWSRIEHDGNVLLYDSLSGDSFQTIYTREVHPFHYWEYVRWPSQLRVLAGRGFRSGDMPEYVLYMPQSGLYYIAAGLGSETFLYYVRQWPANRDTFVADFTGDGRDDVLLYDAATAAFTVASNRGPGEDGNWSGFDETTGTLAVGLELIVSKQTLPRR